MNIWMTGGGRVATLAPGPGDTLVVTTMFGRRVLVHPVGEYGKVLKLAEAFAVKMAPVPVTIKVLCLSLAEAQAMGFAPADMFNDMTPEQEAGMRQLVVATCTEAMRDSNDATVRADAYALLVSLGGIA